MLRMTINPPVFFGAVGHVISNNPFFKIMHVEVNSAVVEVTYDQCGYVDADLI